MTEDTFQLCWSLYKSIFIQQRQISKSFDWWHNFRTVCHTFISHNFLEFWLIYSLCLLSSFSWIHPGIFLWQRNQSMTKPKKWPECPAKTQISLSTHPVWSEPLLCIQWVAMDPMLLHVNNKDWSYQADAQADLNLYWAHKSFCWFCHAQAQFQKDSFLTWIETGYRIDRLERN